MNIKEDKIILLELIPTNYKNNNGVIIQLSALKLNGLKLIERFDYRLKDECLPLNQLKEMINYDNDQFTYVDSDIIILDKLKEFVEDYNILILDNIYTKDYIAYLNNNIDYVYNYLNLDYSPDIINQIISKYNLSLSNHIVDLLYEALMMEY